MDTFVNLRYLRGGGGTSSSGSDSLDGDDYTYNWLHAGLSLSALDLTPTKAKAHAIIPHERAHRATAEGGI